MNVVDIKQSESKKLTTKKILDQNIHFLDGPNSRGSELSAAIKTSLQLIRGFRKLHFVGPCISVFGSARFTEDHPYYKLAQDCGAGIANLGFTTMTGGGPGIMEAANRGAFEAGGRSVGCTIKLPHEQITNVYMHDFVSVDYFYVRKVLLIKYSYAFIVLPGGFGTLDELFETITLIQTGVLNNFPLVILGKEFFTDIQEFIQKMINEKTISEKDKELVLFTDDVNEAMDHISKYISSNYKIKKKPKRFWLLGE